MPHPPVKRYPALTHARKVFAELFKSASPEEGEVVVAYLEGEQTRCRHDTDRELPFRQESNFYYMTGCDIPGSRLLASCKAGPSPGSSDVSALDVHVTLFIPEVDELDVMWSGLPLSPDEVADLLEVSKVYDVSAFQSNLASLSPRCVHVLPGYSLPNHEDASKLSAYSTEDKYLLLASQEARLIKTPIEIELIQQANDITSRAHEGVMRSCGSGDMKSEYEGSAVFNYYCARAGAKGLAYEVIAASGTNAGTLHYIKNTRSFPSADDGDLLLLDAGCEYKYYGADVTRTFPVGNGGKYSKEAKAIYQLVEKMQDASFVHIRPGCQWEDLQIIMHKTLAAGLLDLGILKGPAQKQVGIQGAEDDAQGFKEQGQLIQEILDSGITTAFCGHGLGHALGLDVHDCPLASRPDGPSSHRLCKYLRYRRPLVEGNVITVEPGCYFNPFQLKPFMDSPYLDKQVLERYMPVGGVRIEDDILVTAKGFHNFTTVPRNIEAIEKLCQMNVPIGR